MKLAVLADIHANLAALQCVAAHIETWQPDVVVVAGDTINRGARPVECLEFVRDKQRTHGWHLIWGNHEGYVVKNLEPDTAWSGLDLELNRHSHWTCRQLGATAASLRTLPFSVSLTGPDQQEIRFTHASMRGDRDGVYTRTPDEELRLQLGPLPIPTLFCVGHTHVPLVRTIGDTLVANVGSVGMPFDGDPRASYGRITWHRGRWHAEIVRLPYDREQARQDFFDTTFFPGSGPLGLLILDEFDMARPRLLSWARRYQDQVLTGQMSMEAAVHAFRTLHSPG